MDAEKSRLRQECLKRRRAIDQASFRSMSERLSEQLHDWLGSRSVDRVFGYASFRGEPDLAALYRQLHAEQAAVALPVTDKQAHTIAFHEWGGETMTPGAFGILEPPTTRAAVMPSADSVILVPAVAVARSGKRLGYGGGYYDRFLAGVGNVTLVAVVFDTFILDEVPHEGHDRDVHFIATEMGVSSV